MSKELEALLRGSSQDRGAPLASTWRDHGALSLAYACYALVPMVW
ncbi:hypothetical protein [Candidatus Chloroploca sp. Khr17]|nr:hypothetical protein [Candidatus Chloroploca sp. Khr17]